MKLYLVGYQMLDGERLYTKDGGWGYNAYEDRSAAEGVARVAAKNPGFFKFHGAYPKIIEVEVPSYDIAKWSLKFIINPDKNADDTHDFDYYLPTPQIRDKK